MKTETTIDRIEWAVLETNRQLIRIANALELLAGSAPKAAEQSEALAASLSELTEIEQGMAQVSFNVDGDVVVKDTPVVEMPTYTHDDLKAACLAKSRENPENKVKLKDLLKSYGAAKAVDVPADKLNEVVARIHMGDF